MDLQALTEGCIANVISLTTPRDACTLSLVSRSFMSASESDALWDRFLPPDIHTILVHSVQPHNYQPLSPPSTKKQLYLTLCDNSILFEQGRMSFSLDKWSGKKCYMISARDLWIVWGDDIRYWRWISVPDSRFKEVGELVRVCWLEMGGKIDARLLSPSTLYKAYLVFRSSAARRAYGFDYHAAVATVGMAGGGERTKQLVFLDPENVGHQPRESDGAQYPKEREDGWLEVELGEFLCGGGDGDLEMHFSGIQGGHWKGGLVFQGIEMRPERIV